MSRILVLGVFAALGLYYARAFVLLHQEASTLAQIGLVSLSAIAAVVPLGAVSWRLARLERWLVSLAALCLSAAIFVWTDQSSHSVSDTLNRSVPAIALVVTIATRMAVDAFARL